MNGSVEFYYFNLLSNRCDKKKKKLFYNLSKKRMYKNKQRKTNKVHKVHKTQIYVIGTEEEKSKNV